MVELSPGEDRHSRSTQCTRETFHLNFSKFDTVLIGTGAYPVPEAYRHKNTCGRDMRTVSQNSRLTVFPKRAGGWDGGKGNEMLEKCPDCGRLKELTLVHSWKRGDLRVCANCASMVCATKPKRKRKHKPRKHILSAEQRAERLAYQSETFERINY